ncbi:esterase/lipase family protein [Botrimarina hoheduenensis]|uniref:Alpha/beta hydrolase family protein n=1 Tax=Botrimarina hoheduenensis TaxID=2528000 RepID=A0A5C5W921_9BACT|nr:hypothetical protein [Botrimarina hoheduenensis]TWT46695.1 Alpha/beta hydrolase family protein [Botrimarina hoheduenensis]
MIRAAELDAPSLDASCASSAPFGNELVLMTHGIASTRWLLAPLAARLRRRGFKTRLYGYPSIWWSNRDHGRRLAERVRRLAPQYDRIHLVVHSMGSIVARCAMEESLPENFGRVVMIAPPNRGSHMATRLACDSESRFWNHLVVKPHRTLSPTLVELCDTPDSFVNRLGPAPVGREIGVLAASHDNVLHPEQTHLEGQADHHTVHGWHTGVLWTRETADLTDRFLRTGSFQA